MTTRLPHETLPQFPQLPDYEATWRAIYMEPMMGSGERISVGVIAFDVGGRCGAIKTLNSSRLLALFGNQASGMASMIDSVIDSALRHAAAGNLDHLSLIHI